MLTEVVFSHFFTQCVPINPEYFCGLGLIVPSSSKDLVEKSFFDLRDDHAVEIFRVVGIKLIEKT